MNTVLVPRPAFLALLVSVVKPAQLAKEPMVNAMVVSQAMVILEVIRLAFGVARDTSAKTI